MGKGCGAHGCGKPFVFDEFFGSGFEEGASPFLKPSSRKWGKDLPLKASILAAVLLAIAFGLNFVPGQGSLINLLLLFVYFFAGVPSLIDSIGDLLDLNINIDILMTLAAFSSVLIGSPMEGALLLVLFAVSGSMEEAVTHKAMGAIQELHKIAPKTAYLLDDEGQVHVRALEDIRTGQRILVRAGEIVPLDGTVVEGASDVNLVHMTGENTPVAKTVGDSVPAGGRTLEGALTIEVTHTSADSTISRIVKLITEAQEARPKLQRWFDKVSQPYATSIIGLSGLFALTLPWIADIPVLGPDGSVYRSLAFLIAASPCALIIATPIAYLSAISACARKGILLKGGIMLDALTSCRVIAFDKTGTLTTGELECLGVSSLDGSALPKEEIAEVLSVARALERNAVHPIADAVVRYAKGLGHKASKAKDFRSIPGHGLEALVPRASGEWARAVIGHPKFICSQVDASLAEAIRKEAAEIQKSGQVLTVLLMGNQVTFFRFRDDVRPGAKETLASLQKDGRHRVVMLTGDYHGSAARTAAHLGISDFHAELKPQDKLEHVTQLSNNDGLVMVGDGVNDAPALARATVGVAMGAIGSATAVEASDVVLLHDNLQQIEWLLRKAHATRRIIKQNLFIACMAILIATTPALLGLIPLWLAVLLHEGGTVIVGINGLRLLFRS